MAYCKNNTQKYNPHSRNVTEILDDYFLDRKASKIPGMASLNHFNTTISTTNSSINYSKINSSYHSFNKASTSSVLSKIQEYTRDIKGKQKNQRIEQLNMKMITNVNVMNIRYKDTNTNNYFMSNLNKFKEVDSYNSKAQGLYSQDLYPNKGCWSINVTDKILQYRKKLK